MTMPHEARLPTVVMVGMPISMMDCESVEDGLAEAQKGTGQFFSIPLAMFQRRSLIQILCTFPQIVDQV